MEVLTDAKEEECASASASAQSAPSQPVGDADTTTTFNEDNNNSAKANSATTTPSSSGGTDVGDVSKPLFPAFFYKMRLEGRELVAISKPNKETVAAWKMAGQQALSSAQTNLQSLAHSLRPGENAGATATVVRTPFGTGTLLEYRESTETYVVQLSFGGILYTQTVPGSQQRQRQKQLLVLPFIRKKERKSRTALELNQEFLQWEETRRQEMKQECQRWGIPYTDKTQHQCLACLLAKAKQQEQEQQQQQQSQSTTNIKTTTAFFSDGQGQPRFPRLYKLRKSGQELVTQNKHHVMPDINRCLLCVTPTCAQHSSSAFRKENVALCLDCVQHLECRDLIMMEDSAATTTSSASSAITDLEEQARHLQDLYGRALLLLQYCQPYMETTAQQLDQQTKQHNEIAGVGGSSAGLVSGVLGVAAACTILTPVGPPLLLGSIVMGGSATAVQAGGEAYKYYSEPNQLANRILTLQGIIDVILETCQFMREKTLVPYLDQAVSELETDPSCGATTVTSTATHKTATVVVGAACIGSSAATSAAASLVVQEGAMAGRFVSRATTAAARTARFARFAGGALSAATLVLEARELRRTLDQMEQGNPCVKAVAVRNVLARLEHLPSTSIVQRTCETYVKVRSKELVQRALTDRIIVLPRPQEESDKLLLAEQVMASLEDECNDETSSLVLSSAETVATTLSDDTGGNSSRQLSNKAALLLRVQRYKEREAQKRENTAASTVDVVVPASDVPVVSA